MNAATLDAPIEAPLTQTPLPKLMPDWSWLYDVVDRIAAGQYLTVNGANWSVYENVMNHRDQNRPGLRLQYDRGEIQIMPTHIWHELCKSILGSFIECYCEECEIEFANAGGLTVSQKDRDRGFEPDECFYVQNYPKIIGKKVLDFSTDPPPDLTLEIEITSFVTKRLNIYAAFKVPEVWRFDGQSLTILHLNSTGKYDAAMTSLAFPKLPIIELGGFLSKVGTVGQMPLVREFRQWIRTNLVPKS